VGWARIYCQADQRLLFCKIFFGTMSATLAFVFFAQQCVAVFLGPVGKVNYKGFHLLAGSLTERQKSTV
jgi:hypothetical protein